MRLLKKIVKYIFAFIVGTIAIAILCGFLWYILNPWETKLTLSFQEKPEAIYFFNETGFMSVKKSPVDALVDKNIPSWKAWNSAQTRIIQTNDYGETWGTIYHGTGDIPSLSFNNKTNALYALISLHKKKGGFSSKIIATNDSGKNWENYLSIDEYLRGINFSNKSRLYAWSNNSVFIIKNGEITHSVNLPTKSLITEPVIDKHGNIWTAANKTVFKIVKDNSVQSENLKHDVNIDSMSWSYSKNTLLLVGRGNTEGKTLLISRAERGRYTKIKEFEPLLAYALMTQDENIVVLGSSTQKRGFFGTGKLLFISKDNGDSWSKDFHYPVFARRPVFLNSDQALWVNGAMELIKKRRI